MKETTLKYKPSFPIQIEFIRNKDDVGKTLFKQLNRNGNVCLFSRTYVDTGKLLGYETVVVKLVKAGTLTRGGQTVESDYESYPGGKSFGQYGFFTSSIDRANELFNEMVVKQKNKLLDLNDENEVEETYDIPTQSFTRVEFATFNCLPPLNATNILKHMENDGLIKRVGFKPNKIGKPSPIYSKV